MVPRFDWNGFYAWLHAAGIDPNLVPHDAPFFFYYESEGGPTRVWLKTEILTGDVEGDEFARREIHIRLV